MKLFHLQIFCPFIPTHKAFFSTCEEAISFYVKYFMDKFPFDEATARYGFTFCEDQMENSYSIVKIDTEFCHQPERLFMVGGKSYVKKIKPKEKDGDTQLPSNGGSGDDQGVIRCEICKDGDDDMRNDVTHERWTTLDIAAGSQI